MASATLSLPVPNGWPATSRTHRTIETSATPTSTSNRGRGPDRRSSPKRRSGSASEGQMTRFLLRRLGQAAVTIFIISTIVFLVVYFIPGDPVTAMLGAQGSPEQASALRHEYGLDKPLPVRYGIWLWHALHLDLGTSVLFGKSVISSVW